MRSPALPFLFLSFFVVACSGSSDSGGGGGDGSSGGPGAPGGPNPSSTGATPAPPPPVAPTLAISVATSSLYVAHGAHASAGVTVTRKGWDGAVTVTASGLGKGLTAAPLTVPAGASSASLDIAAAPDADTSPSTASIEAKGNGLSASAKLVVQAPKTAADPSFGSGGIVIAPDAADPVDMIVQPDGKVAVLARIPKGMGSAAGVVRFDDSGALDATFGTAGGAAVDLPFSIINARKLALQPDGKILVLVELTDNKVGSPTVGNVTFGIARLLPTGALDTTFGTAGFAQDDGGGFTRTTPSALAIQADGKIVAVGEASTVATDIHAVAIRFDASGHLDTSFGTGGRFTTYWGGPGTSASASSVFVQGTTSYVTGARVASTIVTPVVASLGTSGALDAGFGAGGITVYGPKRPIAELVAHGSGFAVVEVDGVVTGLTSAGAADAGFGTIGLSDLHGSDYLIDEGRVVFASGTTYLARSNIGQKRLEVWTFADDATPKGDASYQSIIDFPTLGADGIPSLTRMLTLPDGRIVILATPNASDATVLARMFP